MNTAQQRIQLGLAAIVLFLSGYLLNSLVTPDDGDAKNASTTAPSMEELSEKTFEYISRRFLEPRGIKGELIGVGRRGEALYELNLSFHKDDLVQNTTVWVTQDGKLILLGEGGAIIDLHAEAEREQGAVESGDVIVGGSEDDPYLGDPNAPVTIVEYSDFQCPFCWRFWSETLPRIKTKNVDKGLVKFVFRDFPITSIHPHAQKAAEAAQCAFEQGKFWEYHDMLFADFESWQREGTQEFKRIASDLGLDEAKFGECIDSEEYASEVQQDLKDGIAAGVTGTPTFFVNGVKISGAQPLSVFQEIIESQLR
jgi:protein-disulfide isomerase